MMSGKTPTIVVAVAATTLLAACAPTTTLTEQLTPCAQLLRERMEASAAALCSCQGVLCTYPVVIPDFVTVDRYQPQPVGKRLSEEFRLAWQQQCRQPVRVVELGADFRLDEGGLKLLTRDVTALLSDTTSDPVALVGTYRLEGPEQIRYFIRRIHLPTQTATAMAGGYLPRRCVDPLRPFPTRLTD